ncbi:sporulation protein YpjB [Pseudogracilibacillus sp. SE30717A]
MLIGGLIMITLSYVSWRKYRAYEKNKKKRSK